MGVVFLKKDYFTATISLLNPRIAQPDDVNVEYNNVTFKLENESVR